MKTFSYVIPAKVGIQLPFFWIPAYAGMTVWRARE